MIDCMHNPSKPSIFSFNTSVSLTVFPQSAIMDLVQGNRFDFEARMSSSSADCVGGGGLNMFNFMSMIMLSAQVIVNIVNSSSNNNNNNNNNNNK